MTGMGGEILKTWFLKKTLITSFKGKEGVNGDFVFSESRQTFKGREGSDFQMYQSLATISERPPIYDLDDSKKQVLK